MQSRRGLGSEAARRLRECRQRDQWQGKVQKLLKLLPQGFRVSLGLLCLAVDLEHPRAVNIFQRGAPGAPSLFASTCSLNPCR